MPPPPFPSPDSPATATRTGTGPRTYLVEDNATIRENLLAALDELVGITPVGFAECEQSAAAWLLAHAGHWDLAIVDLSLKQGSGLGVLAAIQPREPGQKMIVLSSYVTPNVRRRCQALGADAVFDKSTDIDALIDFCRQLREGDT